jgi:hypothetical protein
MSFIASIFLVALALIAVAVHVVAVRKYYGWFNRRFVSPTPALLPHDQGGTDV